MYELRLVRERRSGYPAMRSSLPNAEAVVRAFRAHFEVLDREQVVVVVLDTKNRPIGFHVVSTGTLNASLIHPRELFKVAILANAASVIVLHNHPSGDPLPSAEDYAITERLASVGKLLGIALLDSIVVGDDGDYFSFADAGRLDAAQNGRERAAEPVVSRAQCVCSAHALGAVQPSIRQTGCATSARRTLSLKDVRSVRSVFVSAGATPKDVNEL